MSEFIDYSRKESIEGEPRKSNDTKRSRARKEKNYAEYSKRDLEDEAVENHDEPEGNFMGEGRRKGKEGPEEDFVEGNSDPFAARGNYRGQQQQQQKYYPQDEGKYYYQDRQSSRSRDYDDEYEAPRRPTTFGGESEGGFGRGGQDLGYDPNDRHCLNDHFVPNYPTRTFVRDLFLTGFQVASFLNTLLGFNILAVVAFAVHFSRKMSPGHKEPPRGKCDKEWETRISGERFSTRAEYYANFFGYQCEDVDVETEDGFVLRVHHITSRKHRTLGHPIIIQHGILSNSVTFMVNEEKSLAFWLLEQGYDVYCSNIRTNFKMPHRQYERADPRYWAWAIKEIGIYDLPALVDYVFEKRGIKPTYIGHSQGTNTMFLALSRGMRPDLGNKLSGFVALGPAVYGGPVLRKFPFSLIRKFKSRFMWSLIFGVREFIPIISILQDLLPGWLFGHAAFPIFAYMFNFHDHNWLNRQIPKYFRTIAVATSSELLYYYMSVLSYKNCVFDTTIDEPWFPRSFPPLAIFYGTIDTLVLGKPLVERIRNNEPNVRLLKVAALENYEHLDMIWGVQAVEECFLGVKDFIEETRGGYPAVDQMRKKNLR